MSSNEAQDAKAVHDARTEVLTYIQMFADRVLPSGLSDVLPILEKYQQAIIARERAHCSALVAALRSARETHAFLYTNKDARAKQHAVWAALAALDDVTGENK